MSESDDLRQRALRLEERLRLLAEVTTAFAKDTSNANRLLDTIAQRTAELLKDYCLVQLFSDDRTHLTPEAIFSPDPELLTQAKLALSVPIEVQSHPPSKRVFETGQPFFAANLQLDALRAGATGQPMPPGAEFGRRIGVHSMLIVPLQVDGQAIGQITLARYRSDLPAFDQSDLDLAQSLARQASLAISNSRLLSTARRELAERTRVESHLRMLAQASAEFSAATHEIDRLVEVMARRISDIVGGMCVIRQLSADGQFIEGAGAVYHPSDELRRTTEQLFKGDRQRLGQGLSGTVAATGKAVLTPHFEPAVWMATTPVQYRQIFEVFAIHSAMTVPLICRGAVIGVANLLRGASEAAYTQDDLRLVQSVADYAGLALGNARAYVAEREARAAAEAATRALQSSEGRFALLAESGLLGVIVAKLNGQVLQINDTLLKMLGYSHREIISGEVPWPSLTPSEWKGVDARATDQLRRTGIGDLREKEYLRKDGTRVPVIIGSAMIDDHEVVSFVLDLTERKQAQSIIETMRREHAADAKFRSLLESAPDAMVIAGENGVISLVNERVESLFGYSRQELLGQPIDNLIQTQLSTLTSQAVGVGTELVGHRKDGSFFPIEVSVRPLQTETGLLVSSSIRDITERKRAEHQRAGLAAIVEASDDAIIGTDPTGVVTSWNHGAERLFGYGASEIIGMPISLISPTGSSPEIATTVSTGVVQRFDAVRRRKDGARVDVSVTSSPVRDSRGVVVGVSKVARDITTRIKDAVALTQAKDAAVAASLELEAFSYSVAHDLRTPLRGMNGFAQVLLEDYGTKLDAEGKVWLNEIMKSAKRMGALIDALLAISRVSRSELNREPVDLTALVNEVAQQLAAAEPHRAVELEVQPGLTVEADPALTRALFDNLLGNAWKFTSQTANARIEVGTTIANAEQVFFVRDNGAGFSMAYANKLFVAFQRLHSTAEFPGIGIGLATVQRIVRRHGGSIWAEGKIGAGATFYFSFSKSAA